MGLILPGSKSHTNRALMLAALAEGVTVLEDALFSDDTRYFAAALTALGFDVRLEEEAHRITVHGLGGRIPARRADLFVGNAGTAARFLTAMLTIGAGKFTLDGNARMRKRPIGDLIIALNRLGADVSGQRAADGRPRSVVGGRSSAVTDAICPPVVVRSSGLAGGSTTVRGEISSQFLSALLMTAPYARRAVEIRVDGELRSRPYIDLTLGVMADFGVQVERRGYSCFCVAPQMYRSPGTYPIEADASAASYFFAVPAVRGGWLEVANLSRSARQGDIAFLNVLEAMGCTVTETGAGIRVDAPHEGKPHGVDVDMGDISDTFLTLAAIAPFASSPTTIRGVASSRHKECDRIAAAVTELRRLGVAVDEHPDGLTVYPCEALRPARVRTYDDHRVAMAFALVGLRVPGIEIENPGCVAKTFPAYFDVLERVRRQIADC